MARSANLLSIRTHCRTTKKRVVQKITPVPESPQDQPVPPRPQCPTNIHSQSFVRGSRLNENLLYVPRMYTHIDTSYMDSITVTRWQAKQQQTIQGLAGHPGRYISSSNVCVCLELQPMTIFPVAEATRDRRTWLVNEARAASQLAINSRSTRHNDGDRQASDDTTPQSYHWRCTTGDVQKHIDKTVGGDRQLSYKLAFIRCCADHEPQKKQKSKYRVTSSDVEKSNNCHTLRGALGRRGAPYVCGTVAVHAASNVSS